MLNELQEYYEIKGIKEIFKSKMEDNDLLFFALFALEIYYAQDNSDELTKEEEMRMGKIN